MQNVTCYQKKKIRYCKNQEIIMKRIKTCYCKNQKITMKRIKNKEKNIEEINIMI